MTWTNLDIYYKPFCLLCYELSIFKDVPLFSFCLEDKDYVLPRVIAKGCNFVILQSGSFSLSDHNLFIS